MTNPAPLVEIWRGPLAESLHSGHVVVCDHTGQIVFALGNPDQVILPRSSVKMIQALPLMESGAADAFGLGPSQLALACASHQGAPMHTDPVAAWLSELGLTDDDMRCGSEVPRDRDTKHAMIRAEGSPCQAHNNCSGKHCGFLTLNKHIGGGTEYVDPTHPVQIAARDAFESVTDMDSPGFGIDGCSAPNFATTMYGLARAMAYFAAADVDSSDKRESGAARLRQAMIAYPHLVAGDGRACTELMAAAKGQAAIKTGAEGVFTAILPERKLGVAVKVTDGATRASECTIAAVLVRLGILDANDPAVIKRMTPRVHNWRGMDTGMIRPAAGLIDA
ncbi:MAG: asparaginase [Rhodovulum sp.]|jgi:L-asparaginase II|nr:asparaginase [Rhodovulum sp.]